MFRFTISSILAPEKVNSVSIIGLHNRSLQTCFMQRVISEHVFGYIQSRVTDDYNVVESFVYLNNDANSHVRQHLS